MIKKMDDRFELLKEINNSRGVNPKPLSKLGCAFFTEKTARKVIFEFEKLGLVELNKTKQGTFCIITPIGSQIISSFNREHKLDQLVEDLYKK